MLIKFIRSQKYFYAVPMQISTTGHMPQRGVYERVLLYNRKFMWLDDKGREIQNENWVEELEKCIGKNTNW